MMDICFMKKQQQLRKTCRRYLLAYYLGQTTDRRVKTGEPTHDSRRLLGLSRLRLWVWCSVSQP